MSSSAPAQSAEEITRASKSNLALAFIALPPERRRDISLFYAFCRQVDDITDDPGFTPDERAAKLHAWRQGLREPHPAEPALAPAVRELVARERLPLDAFEEIILGCEMDVAGTHYPTWEALRLYCYRVASAVGLVSIEIFGCRSEQARQYAVELGLALQLTNILRDVGEDLANGRIYLPADEMARFGYRLEDLHARRHTPEFLALMRFQSERARALFANARELLAAEDHRRAIAAEIMRAVYQRLLVKMSRDNFRVFTRRYRLNRLQKVACVTTEMLRVALHQPPASPPTLP